MWLWYSRACAAPEAVDRLRVGIGADDEQPGLGVQIAGGPAPDPASRVTWDMSRWAARSRSHHSCSARARAVAGRDAEALDARDRSGR